MAAIQPDKIWASCRTENIGPGAMLDSLSGLAPALPRA
jgi:hypothetical protein